MVELREELSIDKLLLEVQCLNTWKQNSNGIWSHNHLVLKRTPVWLNGWVLVYKLSDCGSESDCCHLNFRYRACFDHRVPWHSWSFPIRISSVNLTKSGGNCGFGHIYWRNPEWKTSFSVQCEWSNIFRENISFLLITCFWMDFYLHFI